MLTPPTDVMMNKPTTLIGGMIRKVWWQRLATDLLLFGHDQRFELAQAYGINTDQLDDLMADPEFDEVFSQIRETATTVRGQAQLAAQAAMFVNVRTLHDIATDTATDPKDRISAIKELKDIAGSGDKAAAAEQSSARGPALVLNIGVKGDNALTIDIPQKELTNDE